MKTKKPFLIVCAAALTLALALPFMGVFAFAEGDSFSFTVTRSSNSPYIISYYNGSSWIQIYESNVATGSQTYSLTYRGVVCRIDSHFTTGYNTSHVRLNGVSVSHGTLDSPILLNDGDSFTISYDGSQVVQGGREYTYFMWVLPDPLAPVSDGIDASIDIFGQVIDYVVNTPSVAVFVALSVAAFAIVPAGIVIIKKLIKGY